jgi:hypothetical protein
LLSAACFEAYYMRLGQALGHQRITEFEDDLQEMAGPTADSLRGLPGWLT